MTKRKHKGIYSNLPKKEGASTIPHQENLEGLPPGKKELIILTRLVGDFKYPDPFKKRKRK